MTEPTGRTSPITVVAVHGNGGGAFRFSLVDPDLGVGVRLAPITLPGFQGRRLPPGPVGLDTFTDAIRQAADEVDGPVILLGHGIGGSLCLDVIAHHPDVAAGLILLSPVGVDLDTRLFPRIMSRPIVRRTAKAIIASPVIGATAGRFLFRGAPRPFARRFLAEYGNAEAFEVMFDLLTADWFDALPTVEVPIALLWGGRDRVLDVGHVERFEAALPDTRRVVEPDWGHYPMIEQPAEFATVVAGLAAELVG